MSENMVTLMELSSSWLPPQPASIRIRAKESSFFMDGLSVRDINFGEGMTVMVNQSIPVAVVETPRALKSAAAKAEAGAEAEAGAGDDKEEGGEEKAAEE